MSTVSPRRWSECGVLDTGTTARSGELHGMHCRCSARGAHSSAEVCVGGAASTQLRKSVCGTCLLCPFRVLQRTVRWCALVAALGAGEVGPTARGRYTALGLGRSPHVRASGCKLLADG